MHCPNCGKLLNDNQKFCGGCGSDVSELWQQPTPVAAAPVVDATAQPAPEPVITIDGVAYYHKQEFDLEELFKLDNLSPLEKCVPLATPLVIGNHGINEKNIYEKMNVVL